MRHGIEQQVLVGQTGSLQRLKTSLRKNALTPLVCTVAASFGIFGGVSSLFVGIICIVIHGLVSHDSVFNTVGTVLLIAAIPMILTGSIFLDEIDLKK